MNISELTQLSQEELAVHLMQARQRMYHMREEILHGKEKNHAQLRSFRADIARILTVLNKDKTS